MDPIEYINERVDVAAVFRRRSEPKSLCFPAKFYWRGQEIIISELGLRHPTSAGQRMIHVFDVSDGKNDYRLEFDAEGLTWTLAARLEGHYARA